jgi:DNA-binding GntR family transcriptional regulator
MTTGILHVRDQTLSLTETVTNLLRNSIMTGDLSLGQPVSEVMLSKKYNVGKTPARESLFKLKQEGIVNIIPQKGSFIYDPSLQDVIDLCNFRAYIEPLAIKEAMFDKEDEFLDCLEIILTKMNQLLKRGNIKAYQQVDNEFHMTFFDYCTNPHLKDIYKSVSTKASAIRSNITSNLTMEMAKFTNNHHDEIFNLLTAGKVDAAISVLTAHIQLAKSEFVK